MKLLITGHEGFVGSQMRRVTGGCGLTDAGGQSIDVLDADAVVASITRQRPDAVVHLAAQTYVPDSFTDPRATYDVNFIGTHNLFAGLKASGFTGRVLFVSTSDVYGRLAERDLPATEATPLAPLNPYSVSKQAAEVLCSYWHRTENLDVVIARPFNHIGPGQSTRFALSDFSRMIAEIKLQRREPLLKVGDLDVTRDFTDFRDVIDAYRLLLDKGRPGETYNVCSGIERHLETAVLTLAELAGVEIQIEVDPARLRKADQRRAVGCAQKLHNDTGWRPAIAWQQSLQDMLNHWLKTLA